MKTIRQPAFKLPNDLICDAALKGSDRRLAAALYAHHNGLGVCHKSIRELSALTGMAAGTVKQAAKRLCERGYLSRRQTGYYSKERGAVVRGRTEYVCDLSFRHGFTFVPRGALELALGKAAFSMLLYLYFCSGNENSAYPSITDIGKAIGAARSTVCEALKELRELPMLLVRRCRKVNRAFANSSYIFTRVIATVQATVQRGAAAVAETVMETVAELVPTPPVRGWRLIRAIAQKLSERLFGRFSLFWSRGSPIFDPLFLDSHNDRL